MFSIKSCPLPPTALLGKYVQNGNYTDCYHTDIPMTVTHAQYVTAFYTTFVFKVERTLLKWMASKPSTDFEAYRLADGSIDRFSAWQVEERDQNQLLLTDFRGRTRSWLMTVPFEADQNITQLIFGSAVVATRNPETGAAGLDPVFSFLLGFHKVYSRVLLCSAKMRLIKQASRRGTNCQ
ncbi:MAG: hypothetical protein GY896_10870 [Gammaproteobacteria bacterium]|nr:hypothetical protein [Gammaproteobacteria bacterium]